VGDGEGVAGGGGGGGGGGVWGKGEGGVLKRGLRGIHLKADC